MREVPRSRGAAQAGERVEVELGRHRSCDLAHARVGQGTAAGPRKDRGHGIDVDELPVGGAREVGEQIRSQAEREDDPADVPACDRSLEPRG